VEDNSDNETVQRSGEGVGGRRAEGIVLEVVEEVQSQSISIFQSTARHYYDPVVTLEPSGKLKARLTLLHQLHDFL